MNKTLPALPGKAPALPPGAFEIGYTAQDGAQHRVPLAEAAAVRFADTQPTRRIRTRKGQRHLPGRWWSATDGRHIGYESWLERDQLMWLDWDRAVTGTASQPFRLRWTTLRVFFEARGQRMSCGWHRISRSPWLRGRC